MLAGYIKMRFALGVRINKFIASRTGLSRRNVDQMILKGSVFVNDQRAQVGQRLVGGETVKCNEKKWLFSGEHKLETILMYKPIMSLVSRKPQGNKKTIYDILPQHYHSYKPAGRLDFMSEGLLVMSQNGDLIHQLSHPSNNSQKIYLVGLNKKLKTEDVKTAKKGMTISINDEPVRLASVMITSEDMNSWRYLKPDKRLYWYRFVLNEGRNNQIRRMCRVFNTKVVRLVRIKHGEHSMTPQLHSDKIISI